MQAQTQMVLEPDGITWRRRLFMPKAFRVNESGHRIGSTRASFRELFWVLLDLGVAALVCAPLLGLAAWSLAVAAMSGMLGVPQPGYAVLGVFAALLALTVAILALEIGVVRFIGFWRLRTWTSGLTVLTGAGIGVALLVNG